MAQSLRNYEKLALIGNALSELPGRFFKAGELCLSLVNCRVPARRGQGERALQEISDYPSMQSRACLALGTNALEQGNPDKAIQLYQRAVDTQSEDYLCRFLVQKMTAAALDVMGNVDAARCILTNLESLAYYIRLFYPSYFYNYLNSRAMVEKDREVALRLATIAAGSPYANQFPEWKETKAELLSRQARCQITGVTYSPEVISTRTESMCRIVAVVDDPARTDVELSQCADAVEALVVRRVV